MSLKFKKVGSVMGSLLKWALGRLDSLLCEVYFLLPTIMVFLCYYFVHRYFPGFWQEIITVIVSAVTLWFYSNRDGKSDDIIDAAFIFRNVSIIAVASVIVLFLANGMNQSRHEFGVVLWVIAIGLLVFGIIYHMRNDIPAAYLRGNRSSYYPALTDLFYLAGIIFSAAECYIHFGTQYIWLPVLSSCTFLIALATDEDTDLFGGLSDFSEECLIFLPILLGVVSTLYQFWFANIIFGISLWQMLCGLVSIALVISPIIIVHVVRKNKKRKQLESEEAAKAKEQKAKIDQARIEAAKNKKLEMQKLVDAMYTDGSLTKVYWSDLFVLAEYCKQNIDSLMEIFREITFAPLSQLITISEIKRQIVFNRSDLVVALDLLEKLANHSYRDEELMSLAKQLGDFLNLIEDYQDFGGYKSLTALINDRCQTIVHVVNEKIKKLA